MARRILLVPCAPACNILRYQTTDAADPERAQDTRANEIVLWGQCSESAQDLVRVCFFLMRGRARRPYRIAVLVSAIEETERWSSAVHRRNVAPSCHGYADPAGAGSCREMLFESQARKARDPDARVRRRIYPPLPPPQLSPPPPRTVCAYGRHTSGLWISGTAEIFRANETPWAWSSWAFPAREKARSPMRSPKGWAGAARRRQIPPGQQSRQMSSGHAATERRAGVAAGDSRREIDPQLPKGRRTWRDRRSH